MQLICHPALKHLHLLIHRTNPASQRLFASEAGATGIKKLTLSFVSPYQTILKDAKVEQVNLKTTDGDLGILGGHIPSILQLQPGLIEVFDGPAVAPSTTKTSFFVSGGFALVNPDSCMEISAMEAVPIEHIDPHLVAEGLSDAGKRLAAISATTSDLEKAEIHIHNEVYQALNQAVSKTASK